MSILIKDMKIPKDEPLLVKINPDGTVSTTARNNYKKYEAVELPPHGRLIDADALRYWADDSAMIAFDYVTRSQISAAQTIIEAEEGEG